MYKQFELIRNRLIENKYDLGLESLLGPYIDRYKAGKKFTKRDHCQALLLSVLSANRPWIGIHNHLADLYKVFNGYDPDYLRTANPYMLMQEVCSYDCGNRRIAKQMEEIAYNVSILDEIEKVMGDVDVPMQLAADNLKKVLWVYSDKGSRFKFKGVAIALAAQYMKNLGVDLVKPDVHLRRIIQRFGWTAWLPDEMETIDICQKVAKYFDITQTEVGTILWQYCAVGYIEMCGANPVCDLCPAIKECHYGSTYWR